MELDTSTRFEDGVVWIITLNDPPERVLEFCWDRTLNGQLDWIIVPVYRSDIQGLSR